VERVRRRQGGGEAVRPRALRGRSRPGTPRRRGHGTEVLERRLRTAHVASADLPARAAVRAQAAFRASSTLAGGTSAFRTLAQCFFTFPSSPSQTVERITPTVFLPYIIFSP